MEYILRVLDLEKEIDRLKVINQSHIKYIDSKKRIRDLDTFARKISETSLNETDKCSFLERVEEYKIKIEEYQKAENVLKSKKSGVKQTILSFLLGILCFGAGVKLKEIYKLYKDRKMDEMADYIYEKLSGVESTNE